MLRRVWPEPSALPRREYIKDNAIVTAITLNLLAEEMLAQQAEARDPFKVSLAGAVGLLMVVVLLGTVIAQIADKKRIQADALQSRLNSISGKSPESGDTKSVKSAADDLIAINQSRRLYAEQLALIKDLVPDTIQLDRIGFTLSIESRSAPAVTESTGDAKAARAQRSATVERPVLHLDGRATSSRPEIEVDQFIQMMTSNEAFNKFVGDVKLRSIARNPASTDRPGAEALSAGFVIDCQYRDRK